MVEFNQKWSNLQENGWIWMKIRLFRSNSKNFWSNSTIFDINSKFDLNSDRDFEVRFKFGPRFRIVAMISMDFSNKFESKMFFKTRFEYDLDQIFGRPRSNCISLMFTQLSNANVKLLQFFLTASHFLK